MNESKRYDALDGVRVLAMTGILVMHVLANLSYRDELATLYSYIMYFGRFTSLFMMVSAFSVSCGYYKKIQSGFSNIEKFYSKRYAKILPFFAFITLIDVLLSFSKESIFEGFANITLVFGLIPHESISVIGVGWTLGVIFVFYLLYPFVVYLMKNRIRFCLAYIATLIYAFVVNDYFGLGKVDFLFCACYFMGGAWFMALPIIASLLNFIIFFLGTRNLNRYNPKEIHRRNQFKRAMGESKTVPFPGGSKSGEVTKHKCAVCGRTEKDDPNLEFRFCSKCNGNYEYCQDHLYTHIHKK